MSAYLGLEVYRRPADLLIMWLDTFLNVFVRIFK